MDRKPSISRKGGMTPCSNCVDGTNHWASEQYARVPNTKAVKPNIAIQTAKMLRLPIANVVLLASMLRPRKRGCQHHPHGGRWALGSLGKAPKTALRAAR